MAVIIGGGAVILSGGGSVDAGADPSTPPCVPNYISISCITALKAICPSTPTTWLVPTTLHAIISNKVGYFTSWPDTAILQWNIAAATLQGTDCWIADFGPDFCNSAVRSGILWQPCDFCDVSLASALPILIAGEVRYTTAYGGSLPFPFMATAFAEGRQSCPTTFYPVNQAFHLVDASTGGGICGQNNSCANFPFPNGFIGAPCVSCSGASSCDVTIFT